MIVNWKKKKRKQELMTISRSYRYLLKDKKVGLVRDIIEDALNLTIVKKNELLDTIFFGELNIKCEIAIRQFALQHYFLDKLNPEIIKNLYKENGGITSPLPSIWRNYFHSRSIKVDNLASGSGWYLLSVLNLIYGLWLLFKLPFQAKFDNKSSNLEMIGKYVFLSDLVESNTPSLEKSNKSYDVCSWMAKWYGNEISSICHSVRNSSTVIISDKKITYLPQPYMLNMSLASFTQTLLICIPKAILAFFLIFFKKWQYCFMFPEIIKEHFIRSVPTEALAKDYLFHNSGNTYVPLWAYNVEARGAKIICYFYSTYEQLKAPEGYQSQKFELGAQTWPTFMVWNKFQMNNLKLQYIHKPEFIITGPIFFKRSLADMPKINGRKIAVFDNQPYRLFYFSNISTLAEYKAYSSKLYEKYFLDIKQVLSFYGWTMVLKQKKRMPNKLPKWYRKLIDELSQSKDVIVIDPGIAAEEVIAACDATISFPLTSTGVIADNMNKKSIFYDPSGWVQKDDKGAHGLPVLIGRDELFSWAHKLDVHLSRYSCSN